MILTLLIGGTCQVGQPLASYGRVPRGERRQSKRRLSLRASASRTWNLSVFGCKPDRPIGCKSLMPSRLRHGTRSVVIVLPRAAKSDGLIETARHAVRRPSSRMPAATPAEQGPWVRCTRAVHGPERCDRVRPSAVGSRAFHLGDACRSLWCRRHRKVHRMPPIHLALEPRCPGVPRGRSRSQP